MNNASTALDEALLIGKGLTRRYGATVALRDVDVRLHRGERVTLLGPNGAGKTTLLRILALALTPNAGSVVVEGFDAKANLSQARKCIGLIGHRTGLYDDLTPQENLRLYGRLYGVDPLEPKIERVLGEVGVSAVASAPVGTLSRGMQQRVALARAVIHEPGLLLMDEPETGLDAQGQEWLVTLIDRWAALGRAVLVATHRLDWAGRVADRAIVLKDSSVQAEFSLVRDGGSKLASAYLAAVGEGG